MQVCFVLKFFHVATLQTVCSVSRNQDFAARWIPWVTGIVLPPLSPLEVVAPAYWMRQWGGRPMKEACTATAFVIFPL